MTGPDRRPPDPESAFRPRPQPDQPDRPPGRVRRDDRDGYAAAEQLQAQRPQWMITWGCYSRRFWAWPKFAVTGRVIIHAPYPEILIPRLDEAERTYRLHPPDDTPSPGPEQPQP